MCWPSLYSEPLQHLPSQFCTSSLTHTRKHTDTHKKLCVIWTAACHAVTLAQLVCVLDVNTYSSALHNQCMAAACPSVPSINTVLSLDYFATPSLPGNATDILTECFSMVPPVCAALFPFNNGWWTVIAVTYFILQCVVVNIKKGGGKNLRK